MQDPYQYPKLRWPIDISMEVVEGQEVILLNCPLGIAEQPLGLIAGVGPLLGTFDGQRSIEDIANQFAAQQISPELLNELVKMLDDHFYLESPRFYEQEQQVKKSFLAAPVRDAALAGLSYAAHPAKLGAELDGYLAMGAQVSPPSPGPMIGLMAPHID